MRVKWTSAHEMRDWLKDVYVPRVGLDECQRAYRGVPAVGLHTICFSLVGDDRQPMGWSVLKRIGDSEWEHSAGILPEHRSKGYAIPFRHTVCKYAFDFGFIHATAVWRCVLHSNFEFARRCYEAAKSGQDWPRSGEIWTPGREQDIYICTRAAWDLRWSGMPTFDCQI